MRCLLTKLRRFNYYDDMARACHDNGIMAVSEYCENKEDGEKILDMIDRFRPDFILSHPAYSLIASRVGHLKGIPVLHWLADKFINRDHLNRDIYTDTDFIFPTCREDTELLRKIGVKASYMLNVCNLKPVHYHTEEKKYGVSFVGTIELGRNNYYRQVMEAARETFNQDSELHRSIFETMQNAFDAILQQQKEAAQQFRYILPELIAKTYEQIGPILLQSNIQPDNLAFLLAKETAFHQRRHFIEALPHLDAFGPEDWTKAELPNVRYWGEADQYRESGHVFGASRINLAIARIYAMDGLSDRIFNVLFAQGFLLANRQETLSEVFQEGVDLEMYTTADELLDKIRFYENNPQAREKIARQGHDNVVKNHTFTNRIREMLPLLDR
ncbi:MAG: glycosyltransferase [Magnetococcales bacterium]|nr:glycosyltransferase [Magnetococcales bacterium]